jgi:hypothetical protein
MTSVPFRPLSLRLRTARLVALFAVIFVAMGLTPRLGLHPVLGVVTGALVLLGALWGKVEVQTLITAHRRGYTREEFQARQIAEHAERQARQERKGKPDPELWARRAAQAERDGQARRRRRAKRNRRARR